MRLECECCGKFVDEQELKLMKMWDGVYCECCEECQKVVSEDTPQELYEIDPHDIYIDKILEQEWINNDTKGKE